MNNNGSQVGESMKSIFQRVTRLSKDNIDNIIKNTFRELSDDAKVVLKKYNVEIKDTLIETLNELSKIWNNLNEDIQKEISTEIMGVRNRNALTTFLDSNK